MGKILNLPVPRDVFATMDAGTIISGISFKYLTIDIPLRENNSAILDEEKGIMRRFLMTDEEKKIVKLEFFTKKIRGIDHIVNERGERVEDLNPMC